MKNPIHKRFVNIIIVALALASITLVTGCSQKPTAAENAAQIQAAVDKAVVEAKQQFIADQQAAENAKRDEAAQAEEKHKQQEAAAAEKKRRIAEQHKAAEKARSQQAMAGPPPQPAYKAVCADCGVVVSIKPVETEGQGSGLGVIAGGVLGGLLGNQVGNGTGRDLATIGGAVAGAVAGNKIEKNAKKATSYDITVRMDNGETVKFNQTTAPNLATDERVKIENGKVVKF